MCIQLAYFGGAEAAIQKDFIEEVGIEEWLESIDLVNGNITTNKTGTQVGDLTVVIGDDLEVLKVLHSGNTSK